MSAPIYPDCISQGMHPCDCSVGYSSWHLLALGRLHPSEAAQFLACTLDVQPEVLRYDLGDALVGVIPFFHADPVRFTANEWATWVAFFSCRTPLEIAAITQIPLVVGWYPSLFATPMHHVVRDAVAQSMTRCGWRSL